jgi:hypothetical protein
MNRLATIALIAVAACGRDSIGPANRTIAPGVYAHTLTYNLAGGGTLLYSGVLRVSSSTSDALTGTWEVAGYATAMLDGQWNADAFRVVAQIVASSEQAIFRISRRGSQLDCSGLVFHGIGGAPSTPSACTFVPGPPPTSQPIFTSIRVSPQTATYGVGCSVLIGAEGLDQFGNRIGHSPFAWTSSDVSTVSVSGGFINCHKRGAAVITASADGKTAQSTITVQ